MSVLKYKKKPDDFCSLIFRFKTDRWQTCDTDIQQINHGLCFTEWKHTCDDIDKQRKTRWFSHSVLQRENIIVPNIKCKQNSTKTAGVHVRSVLQGNYGLWETMILQVQPWFLDVSQKRRNRPKTESVTGMCATWD